MPTLSKTALMSLRMTPQAKALLLECAQREHRSMANMMERMVYDYARAHGVDAPEVGAETPAAPEQNTTKNTKKAQ